MAQEGATAFQEKRWADAVDLFKRAESLVHAPPHLLFMARAQVELGQLVGARENYMRIIRETISPDAPKAFRDAQAAAKSELPALEPRIPTLTVKVKGNDGKPVNVTIDGKALPPALIGAPRPTDPGEHRLQASAEGMASEVTSIVLKEGAREAVTLELIAGKAAAVGAETVPATGPAAAPAGSPESPAAATADQSGGRSKGLRIASYAAFGVGVVGLGVGTFFGLRSMSKRSKADDICPNTSCGIEHKDEVNALDDDARSAKTLATIGFIAGGVGVAAGVTLFVLSSKKESASPAEGRRPQTRTSASARAPELRAWVGPLGAGVRGTF